MPKYIVSSSYPTVVIEAPNEDAAGDFYVKEMERAESIILDIIEATTFYVDAFGKERREGNDSDLRL